MSFQRGYTDYDGILRFPTYEPRQQRQETCYRWCRLCNKKTPVTPKEFSSTGAPICSRCWHSALL